MEGIKHLKQEPICRLNLPRGQPAAATVSQTPRVTYCDTSHEESGSFPVCWFSVSIRIDLRVPKLWFLGGLAQNY